MGIITVILKIIAIAFFLVLSVWCFLEGVLSTMFIPYVIGILLVIEPVRNFLFEDCEIWLLVAPLIGVKTLQWLLSTERFMGIILGIVCLLFTFLVIGNALPALGEFATSAIAGLGKVLILPVAIPFAILVIFFFAIAFI